MQSFTQSSQGFNLTQRALSFSQRRNKKGFNYKKIIIKFSAFKIVYDRKRDINNNHRLSNSST